MVRVLINKLVTHECNELTLINRSHYEKIKKFKLIFVNYDIALLYNIINSFEPLAMGRRTFLMER